MIESIIGVDCATVPGKTGLARASKSPDGWFLTDAFTCDRDRAPLDVLVDWLSEPVAALLALDAPLGWPIGLSEALSNHYAGQAPDRGSSYLFRRETDRFTAKTYKKTPLDVGADRIARTANWALSLLEFLRRLTDQPIRLAWDPQETMDTAAIEVYPAATLRAHGVSLVGYRKGEGRSLHRRLAAFILKEVPGAALADPEEVGIDGLDAALCVVAGRDFLLGKCIAPQDVELARKEGWIWTREPLGRSE